MIVIEALIDLLILEINLVLILKKKKNYRERWKGARVSFRFTRDSISRNVEGGDLNFIWEMSGSARRHEELAKGSRLSRGVINTRFIRHVVFMSSSKGELAVPASRGKYYHRCWETDRNRIR
ncbi:hypothetical protein WN944_000368 [Citrus x changshan-huyou]|uniref:Uncharacterized protein n=1 Tax=Citrus x changshan-huyou TaxID=2935761 RepID=A0AAP0QPM8_9ROSI